MGFFKTGEQGAVKTAAETVRTVTAAAAAAPVKTALAVNAPAPAEHEFVRF